MRRFDYYAPETLQEAVTLLRTKGQGGKVLAGGTDLVVHMKEAGLRPAYVVSLRRLEALRAVRTDPDGTLHIGPLVSMAEAVTHPEVGGRYPIIADGAGVVGSVQTRNMATVGGNLCNAAPSADTAPPLLALDASVRIAGAGANGATAERTVPLAEFWTGPGQTVLGPDELLADIVVPPQPARSGGYYERHTPRKEMDIAVVGVGVQLSLTEDGRIGDVRIALGAVAPTPVRAVRAEEVLRGRAPEPELLEEAGRTAAGEARPISDVRGSAEFRRELVRVMTRRCLERA
ncbi:MAG TPA: xanthine dehydrogenase family protein subunit M, partial [Dehalococcoidia bacterium]